MTEPPKSAPALPPQPGPWIPSDWVPLDVPELEPAIEDAIRDAGNVAVVAGPGAGKTEFLAQRAAYLMQTGLCRPPQRILAISFKRDSAANLARRVATRLPEHSERLTSMTFDAFTKGLLDRFNPALPAGWALRRSYSIDFPRPRALSDFITRTGEGAPPNLQGAVYAVNSQTFLTDVLGTRRLTVEPPSAHSTVEDYVTWSWWQEYYVNADPQVLEFTMVNRLAELLVRTSAHIRRALRQTYPFVFIDEFQDTTAAQFDFLKAVFGGYATITAVGDRKQRIMGFAGALPNAVEAFLTDFDATRYDAHWNFRSNTALVDLQQVIAGRLETDVAGQISKAPTDAIRVPASIWSYDTPDAEAAHLAHAIANDIANSDRTPSDFAVLGRQKVADWEPLLAEHLRRHNIRLRNDDRRYGQLALQDILKHDVARYVLGMLHLAANPHGQGVVWLDTLAILARIRGIDDDGDTALSEELASAVSDLRGWQAQHPPAATATLSEAADAVIRALGPAFDDVDSFVRSQHRGEEDGTILLTALAHRLLEAMQTQPTWTEVVDAAEASDAVSLLTVHRSKGLEYHTVFFVGMDEDRWWAHQRDKAESTSTFFVGLSRAAQRIVFTSTGQNRRRDGIADLFAMLTEAGVPETHWR